MNSISPKTQIKLMVATPCYGGLLTQGYVESIIELIRYSTEKEVHIQLAMLGQDALITRSRNRLVSAFLNDSSLTHLLFIDADIAFAPEAVGRLLDHDEDVVAGLYPLKVHDWSNADAQQRLHGEPPELASLAYVGTFCEGAALQRRGDFVTAIYAGTGFMLIRRRVLEMLAGAHPELRYTSAHVYPRPNAPGRNLFAIFDCMIEPETGAYLSEDYAFCRRWRDQGGRIWLDTRSKLSHIGSHCFAGDTSMRFASEGALLDPVAR